MNILDRLSMRPKKIIIKSHIKCDEEFEVILNKTSDEALLLGQFKQRLEFLEDNIQLLWKKKIWFGVLESNKKFKKIIFLKTEHNVRIAFYITDDKKPVVVLLYAFEEKSGNNGKTLEYKKASDICEKRLEEVMKNGKTK